MKKCSFLSLGIFMAASCFARTKDTVCTFYGQVRADYFYNSRANVEMVDGLFYLYPKGRVEGTSGGDLNAVPNSGLYLLYSRLGVDVKGPDMGAFRTSAKVEADFRGSGGAFSVLRLRHAYFELHRKRSAWLVGQTWHPLFGDVSPRIQNLGTGAPFQPFSRAPQIRYRYTATHWQMTAAAVWQSQFLSKGIDVADASQSVRSQEYLKRSGIPEIYLGADYMSPRFMAGAGMELLSIRPRMAGGGNARQGKERITTLSYEAHARYTSPRWFIAAKSVLGANLTQVSSLGGFGIKAVDPLDGKQEYTPLRFLSTWMNAVHGRKWKKGIFAGYARNLGTDEAILDGTVLYGTGTDIAHLATLGFECSYNLPQWRFGLEYTWSRAQYEAGTPATGKTVDAHAVSNHRAVAAAVFLF